jgi:hypothetical protein
MLRPANGHVEESMRDNLDQMRHLYPSVASVLDSHDGALDLLGAACAELQGALTKSSEMRRVYDQATAPESLDGLGVTLQGIFGGYDEESRLGLLAQYTINRIDSLPDYYAAHGLWNAWSSRFLELLDAPSIRDRTSRMDEAGEMMIAVIRSVIAMLEEQRLALSLRYDVPYRIPEGGNFDIEV